MRGMITLFLRMVKHEENAKEIAEFLTNNEYILNVLYPGRGGMISFRIKNEKNVDYFYDV